MNNYTIKSYFHYLIISLVAALLFIPFLGGVHLFDWDEINFAESAREMIVSGDYLNVQINYEFFWEKPPLFIWMQVLSMKIFGINEFAARFPNAICGILTLLFLYSAGKKEYDKSFGIIWTMVYAGSLLPLLYFKSGIIDPWFNLFIFSGLYCFIVFTAGNEKDRSMLLFSAVLIGLAVMTKGPVAVLIFVLTVSVFFLFNKFRLNVRFAEILLYVLVLSFVGGFWFILQIVKGNFDIIADFIAYQIRLFKTEGAGHGGFLFYHFVVLLFGVFPASFIALPSFFSSGKLSDRQKTVKMWMLILFWVVLILFTLVKTKIVHYSSLCYFPLTFLAALTIQRLTPLHKNWKKTIFFSITVVAVLYAFTIGAITYMDSFKHILIKKDLIGDVFALECLKADGGWKGYEFLAGLILFTGIVSFIILWTRGRDHQAMILIFPVTTVFLFVAVLMITPRVEKYSQHAAVEFFQSVSNEDAYLATLGYKSYVHLFYGKVTIHENPSAKNVDWLLQGDIDKTVYFAIKIDKKEGYLKQYPELTVLYEKNGFVFCERKPD